MLPLKIVRYFGLYFLGGLVLDFLVCFPVGFDAGFGVGFITDCAVARAGVSVGICVLVLVVGIGSNKNHSPVMKIIEPGIAKTG